MTTGPILWQWQSSLVSLKSWISEDYRAQTPTFRRLPYTELRAKTTAFSVAEMSIFGKTRPNARFGFIIYAIAEPEVASAKPSRAEAPSAIPQCIIRLSDTLRLAAIVLFKFQTVWAFTVNIFETMVKFGTAHKYGGKKGSRKKQLKLGRQNRGANAIEDGKLSMKLFDWNIVCQASFVFVEGWRGGTPRRSIKHTHTWGGGGGGGVNVDKEYKP